MTFKLLCSKLYLVAIYEVLQISRGNMNSHKTAISRKTGSRPLQDLIVDKLINGDVLDYGAGKGADTKYLIDLGYTAIGYDPYYTPDMPQRKFDTVFCNYVINVISDYATRTALVNILLSKCKRGGHVIITTRTTKEINKNAINGDWRSLNDGFLTSRGTFQIGFNSNDLIQYLPTGGKIIKQCDNSKYSYIIIEKL